MKRVRWRLLIGALLCGACGLLRSAKPESLPDGSYRLSCATSLAECLASLDTVCRDGFDVIHAQEKRERRGPPPVEQLTFSSEALLRCRTPEPLFALFGSDRAPGSLSASDSAVPEDASAPDSSAGTTTSDAASQPPPATGP